MRQEIWPSTDDLSEEEFQQGALRNMNWFLASLIAPLIWSLVNHSEKIILSRFFRGGDCGALMIFIGLVALPLAAAIILIENSVFAATVTEIAILTASGVLYSAACFFYLKTLEKHDASFVVPFWQLTPVFAYLFGLFILHERVALDKLGGGATVIMGALILSVRFQERNISFDWRSIALMCVSSLLLALSFVLFKLGEGGASFWVSQFWNQIGMAGFGAALFLAPHWRRSFFNVMRENGAASLSLNVVTQIFDIAAVVAANFAVRLAPAALVVLIEYSFQPLFVLIFGVLFSVLFPRWVSEDMSIGSLFQRAAAISVMAVGLIFVL